MNVKEVYKAIRHYLDNKIPFALARIGDGESMVLHTGANTRPTRMNWFLKNQFGFIMPDDYVLEIKKLIMEGYSHCDIIGVPTQRHKDKFGTYWSEAENKMHELSPKTKKIAKCSIDIHSELLASGLINNLIDGQKELVCIFGRDLDEPLKRRFNLDKVYSYKVTPEQRYEVNKVVSKYYPEQYNEVIQFIKNTDCKGKLCLVGCGMLGKYYTWKLKEAGGIAIDVGHIPDAWSGLVTRGKHKGAGKTNNDYKL